MSYPRAIQALIIEDESGPRQFYEGEFLAIEQSMGIVIEPVRFAYSHADAVAILAGDAIFHLVILDLRLPPRREDPAAEDVNHGLDLLERCANRNTYPIPALLVVSAHLDKVAQGAVDARLQTAFAHGRLLVKSPNLRQDFTAALNAVLRYCDVGVHLRDDGTARFPTLSPRDEDLLRRAMLETSTTIGLDLRWWSADCAPPAAPGPSSCGWTKVLAGSVLLDGGRGRSRPTFFKFAPAEGARDVVADARLMEMKLSHIKVTTALIAGDRSLLVTQKVGESDTDSISLEEFLTRPSSEVLPSLRGIVQDTASQIARLSDAIEKEAPLATLLWPYHDDARISTQWGRWGGVVKAKDPGADAVALFRELGRNRLSVWFWHQSVLHGDLNASNVAIELRDGGAHGYIFDASGSTGGVCVRDLAMLEVTALLHRRPSDDCDLELLCRTLYADWVFPPDDVAAPASSDHARNAFELVIEVRRKAKERSTPSIYALMVFDTAMLQLGGLEFAVSRNKIGMPEHAVVLCGSAAQWLRRVASVYVSSETSAASASQRSA